jgi:hypothetical protein
MLMASQDAAQLLGLKFPARLEQLLVPELDSAGIHLWHASPQSLPF